MAEKTQKEFILTLLRHLKGISKIEREMNAMLDKLLASENVAMLNKVKAAREQAE